MARFTGKQEAFIDHYIITKNATEAARRAGYQGDDGTLAVIGHENLRKPKIMEEIEHRFKARAMKADEVLMRHADIARGTMQDFISFVEYENVKGEKQIGFKLDLEKAEQRGVLHLIQELSYNAQGLPKIKLYDAKSAQRTIMEHLGLLNISISVDWRKEAEEKGVDAGELFERLVNQYVSALTTSDGAHPGGSVARGETQDQNP